MVASWAKLTRLIEEKRGLSFLKEREATYKNEKYNH